MVFGNYGAQNSRKSNVQFGNCTGVLPKIIIKIYVATNRKHVDVSHVSRLENISEQPQKMKTNLWQHSNV